MVDQKTFAQKISGTERAAILLMSLGENEASEVLRHIGAKEVQKIGTSMATMKSVSRDEATDVLEHFVTTVDEETSLGVGADEYVRRVLTQALGEKASSLIDRVLLGQKSKGLEALKWMDPRSVAEMIRQEHPQIIAIVLAYLESDHAAEVLSALPDQVRPDVIMRIATLDGIPPSAFNELDQVMEKQFAGNENLKSSSVGGIRSAAEILNLVEGSTEEEVMEAVRESDQALGDQIQEQMFVFDNLKEIDDRGIQSLLRDVQSDTLVVALKGADNEIKEKIFGNMSRRAAEMLEEDLEAKGPVRISDVEAAQKEILTTARRLADQGEIQLGGKGEEYV
ncbi:flagellar motor switch protein FliG [Wenzhouxiangella sp. AB-CW3]|uniref:flagellar motor switch protein FliG n=1 Tax=Wenzhouxiangella sp. AB-CW3 TaxID=2771012 RepID=UPI00168C0DD0|nr:flagellar motor switch protein FliG [Wenzhouxiangella sp. AB-CW3]QOC21203.1 flagellar motor switch protein FliG [Wenzhouxiangella sp. AB-CW3]